MYTWMCEMLIQLTACSSQDCEKLDGALEHVTGDGTQDLLVCGQVRIPATPTGAFENGCPFFNGLL